MHAGMLAGSLFPVVLIAAAAITKVFIPTKSPTGQA